MSSKHSKRRKAIIRRRIFVSCCVVVLALLIIGISAIVKSIIKTADNEDKKEINSSQVSSGKSKEPYVVSTAKVVNTGDIIVHSTVLDGAKTADGYDFSSFFPNVKKYFNGADLAVANLEVTFGGSESGKFSGYPAFNTPDSLADTIKNSGINFLLTANNHCYDTGMFGLKRTAQILKSKNMDFIGTKELDSDPAYVVKKVNGIKIGMTCYTYENSCDVAGRKSINGAIISTEANGLLNSFSYDYIDKFYSEAQKTISLMKKDGADCIVFYMHWGEEYQLKQNTWQKTIAQKLCNLGVDVIVGGHPHVVQPIELLHSEDSQNTSVCIYSMGNAISNQRQELMSPECTTGHTEDGMLFYYTFDKYSDGTTVLSSVDIIPTWVNKYKGGSGYQYTMIPLENATDGVSLYGLTGDSASRCQKSYERTKQIVMSGLTQCQTTLGCKLRFTD